MTQHQRNVTVSAWLGYMGLILLLLVAVALLLTFS